MHGMLVRMNSSLDSLGYRQLCLHTCPPERISSETLNIVLDGSAAELDAKYLDAKYGHLFEKRKNVPVEWHAANLHSMQG